MLSLNLLCPSSSFLVAAAFADGVQAIFTGFILGKISVIG